VVGEVKGAVINASIDASDPKVEEICARRMTRRPQPSGSVSAMAAWKIEPSRNFL
jgi:hypothetical protein